MGGASLLLIFFIKRCTKSPVHQYRKENSYFLLSHFIYIDVKNYAVLVCSFEDLAKIKCHFTFYLKGKPIVSTNKWLLLVVVVVPLNECQNAFAET